MADQNLEKKLSMASTIGAKSSFTILIVGASGTGKSALINALTGAENAKEGGETLFSQTIHITSYKSKRPGFDVKVWDSPGIETVSTWLGLEKLVTDIATIVREVDVVLFCTNMTSARFRQGDSQNVRIITKTFGESIWRNAVFVLTFANQVKPPPSRKGTPPRDYFDERLLEWKGQIVSILKKSGVPDQLAEAIKITPAGYRDEYSLPGQYNWLNDLLSMCLQVSKDNAPVVLQASVERLKTEQVAYHQTDRQHREKSLLDHVAQASYCYTITALAVVGGVVGVLAGGVVGCAAGIGVGAVCGIGAAGAYGYLHK